MIIFGGLLGGSSVIFIATFCAIIGGCAGISTEKAVEDFSEPFTMMINFLIFWIPVIIFILLLFYRRTIYVDESLFIFSVRGKRMARKCKICGKHPLFQKYHAKKIHNLSIDDLEENFDDCGCDLCYERKTNWEGHRN